MKPLFTQERRICIVYSKHGTGTVEPHPAFFHTFAKVVNHLLPGSFKPGETVAIVEYRDGTVGYVSPHSIRFLDTEGLMKQYAWEEKEEPKQ